jgi:hypothetical protein
MGLTYVPMTTHLNLLTCISAFCICFDLSTVLPVRKGDKMVSLGHMNPLYIILSIIDHLAS